MCRWEPNNEAIDEQSSLLETNLETKGKKQKPTFCKSRLLPILTEGSQSVTIPIGPSWFCDDANRFEFASAVSNGIRITGRSGGGGGLETHARLEISEIAHEHRLFTRFHAICKVDGVDELINTMVFGTRIVPPIVVFFS